MKKILVTGVAGFIGFHFMKRALAEGMEVVGLDNINDYYDVNIKYARLAQLGFDSSEIQLKSLVRSKTNPQARFIQLDLLDSDGVMQLCKEEKFDGIVNLAAQAGVRYSLTHPHVYTESNITGFLHILEAARHTQVKHLVFASSSSVYGLNDEIPFSTKHNTDHPISLYAASKKANELMAHSYSHLYNIPCTGLRFFSAYGPWGRPDMALFIFTQKIIAGEPIDVYNHGKMKRDFTYIDDLVDGVYKVLHQIPQANPDWKKSTGPYDRSSAPYKLYNIGNNDPIELKDFIVALEEKLNKKAICNMCPMQAGDVSQSWADSSELIDDVAYEPKTTVKEGISKFVDWYIEFYKP
ncbi:MAG TPA: NAD-dependent epimerase [Bacteroidia bacterium]